MHLGLESPRINFFAVDHSRENVHAIAQTIRLMLSKTGEAVGNDDLDAIEKGVERMFDLPREVRQLRHLSLPPRLRKGLKRWLDGGIYGAIFDNVEDDMQFHDLQLFDFANLDEKHEDLLEVEMSWILYLCQNVIRDPKHLGTPKHLIIDELWKRVGILPVIKFLLETIKADSKNLAWATLVTQSLEDLGPYAAVIKNACPNTMFLGGAFDRELYQKHFRLNERELEQLESLGERELAVKVDGEPFVNGGQGYFKVLRMNLDPAAYVRATTKPSERLLREQPEGAKSIASSYRAARGSKR